MYGSWLLQRTKQTEHSLYLPMAVAYTLNFLAERFFQPSSLKLIFELLLPYFNYLIIILWQPTRKWQNNLYLFSYSFTVSTPTKSKFYARVVHHWALQESKTLMLEGIIISIICEFPEGP